MYFIVDTNKVVSALNSSLPVEYCKMLIQETKNKKNNWKQEKSATSTNNLYTKNSVL